MVPAVKSPSRLERTGRQLILDLPHEAAFGSEDFLVSPSNADAYDYVDLWPEWPAPMLIVTGPPGCGKSHLAAIWSRLAKGAMIGIGDTIEPVAHGSMPAVVIEDCDRARYTETALFHLLNVMRETGGWLMLTARTRPDLWGVGLADLLSRLRLAPTIVVGPPDPPLMRAVLVKLFGDRQIHVDEEVVTYAALHLDQSLDEAARFVQAIDDESLAAGRRITRNLAVGIIAALRATELQGPT